MTPKSLAAIPAALEVTGETSALDLSVGQFLDSHGSSPRVVSAVRTVAGILRIGRLRDLCTNEAEGLFANRYSAEIARQVIEDLWKWLLMHAAGPGPRLADAPSKRNGIVHHEVEIEDGNEDGNDDDDILHYFGDEPDSSADAQHLHLLPPPKARESLPAAKWRGTGPLGRSIRRERATRRPTGPRPSTPLALRIHNPGTTRHYPRGGSGHAGQPHGPKVLPLYAGFPARRDGQVSPAPRGAGGGHRAKAAGRARRPHPPPRRSLLATLPGSRPPAAGSSVGYGQTTPRRHLLARTDLCELRCACPDLSGMVRLRGEDA